MSIKGRLSRVDETLGLLFTLHLHLGAAREPWLKTAGLCHLQENGLFLALPCFSGSSWDAACCPHSLQEAGERWVQRLDGFGASLSFYLLGGLLKQTGGRLRIITFLRKIILKFSLLNQPPDLINGGHFFWPQNQKVINPSGWFRRWLSGPRTESVGEVI